MRKLTWLLPLVTLLALALPARGQEVILRTPIHYHDYNPTLPLFSIQPSTVHTGPMQTWLDALGNIKLRVMPSGNLVVSSGGYANFGTSEGVFGYGFRDNGGVIEFKNSGGAWTSISSLATPVVNVQAYGAVCNDTDVAGANTAAIQAAVDAIVPARGGIVLFPVEGCTGPYKFGALTPPAMPHGWITFRSENDWTITHEIDWLNSNTAIRGRSGSVALGFQGRPAFKILNGAALTNAINNQPIGGAYETGIYLEGIGFAGFTNSINLRNTHLVTLKDVFNESVAGRSVILNGCFGVEIDGGTYFAPTDGSAPSIKIYQENSATTFNPVNYHFHDFMLNYGGIEFASDLVGGGWGHFSIHDVEYENAIGTYASPITFAGAAANAIDISVARCQVSDPDAGSIPFPFINMTGAFTARQITLDGFDSNGPHIGGTVANAYAVTIKNPGVGAYAATPGITRGVQYTNTGASQGFSERVCMGFDFAACLASYFGPQSSITADNTTTAQRIIVANSSLTDALRVQDVAGNKLFGINGDDGTLASARVGGSLQLVALTSPGTPTVTNGGTPGAATWGYKVVAVDASGRQTAASAEGTTATGNAALDATNYNILTFLVSPNAVSYQIWLTTVPGGATIGGAAAVAGLVAPIPAVRENPYHSYMVYNHTTANGAGGTASTINNTGLASFPTLDTTTVGTPEAGKNLTVNSTLGAEEAPALTTGNWTFNAGYWQYLTVPDRIEKFADGTGTLTPTAATTIVAGTTYRVSITVDSISGSTATTNLGGNTGISLTAPGTVTFYTTAYSTGKLIISPVATGLRIIISAISINAIGTEKTQLLGDVEMGGKLRVPGSTVDGAWMTPDGYLNVGEYNVSGGLRVGIRKGITNGMLTISSLGSIDTAGHLYASQEVKGSIFLTATDCASSASPAVCGSSSGGSFVIAATATSVTVNTTAVTANSKILITRDNSLGTKLSVTCNTQGSLILGSPFVSARTAATSFTVDIDVAPTTNPMCLSYLIVGI